MLRHTNSHMILIDVIVVIEKFIWIEKKKGTMSYLIRNFGVVTDACISGYQYEH